MAPASTEAEEVVGGAVEAQDTAAKEAVAAEVPADGAKEAEEAPAVAAATEEETKNEEAPALAAATEEVPKEEEAPAVAAEEVAEGAKEDMVCQEEDSTKEKEAEGESAGKVEAVAEN